MVRSPIAETSMVRSAIADKGQGLMVAYPHLDCGMLKVEEGEVQVVLVRMEAWRPGLGKAVVRVEDLSRERKFLGW